MEFLTESGLIVATDYVRLVQGGRGDYIEFAPEHMCMANLIVPEDQQYRLLPQWKDRVYYFEFRTEDECNLKVYYQRRTVEYADYKIGMFYIAPHGLTWGGSELRTVATA
jgi:hypothetical protein